MGEPQRSRAARVGHVRPQRARGPRLPPADVLLTGGAAALVVAAVLGGAAGVAAAGAGAPGATGVPPAAPGTAGEGRLLCRLVDERVDEASGLAVAGGLLWTHDDSGEDVGGLLALDAGCRTVAVLAMPGVDLVDAEDVAAGCAPDGTTVLWLADTGDNRARRDQVALLRVPLPAVPVAALPETADGVPDPPVLDGEAVAFPLQYADGPRDAEALLLDATGAPALVSKPLLGRPGVYLPAVPLLPGEVTVLRRGGDVRLGASETGSQRQASGPAGPLSASLVTAGAVAPDGGAVVLATYTDAHVWRARGGERTAGGGLDLVGMLGRLPDVVLPMPPLEQAEAVAWTADGQALLVTGEGRGAPVHLLPVPSAPVRGAPDPAAQPGPAGSEAAPGEAVGTGPPPDGGGTLPPQLRPAAVAVAVLVLVGWSARALRRGSSATRLARRTRG